MVPCAYLRAYQPLDAFPGDEQSRWERFILEGDHATPRPAYRQRTTVGRLGLMAPADGDRADILLVDGVYHVCPWNTRLRVLAGLLSFREVAPLELSDHFVPEDEARRAQRELARLRRQSRESVSFIHQAPWHVPIRWFALFSDEERRLTGDPESGYRLRYMTSVRTAHRRAERAIPVLRKADLAPIGELLEELLEWLAVFDHRSILELDYDGLADLLSWNELDDDHSARDIQEAIEALSIGEYPRSAEIYQRVLGRWSEVRSREQLN